MVELSIGAEAVAGLIAATSRVAGFLMASPHLHRRLPFSGRLHPVPSGNQNCQEQQVGQLGGERLGGRHADLGACLGHERDVGLAHQRAGGNVADGERREVAERGS